jgi:hypothetical protein
MAGQQPEELLSGVTGGSSHGDTRDRARRDGGTVSGAWLSNCMHQEAYLYTKSAIGSMKIDEYSVTDHAEIVYPESVRSDESPPPSSDSGIDRPRSAP